MASLVTARALILLQLGSRLLTFGLNQALVRLAPPEVFGTAAIQFDLICSTILFLSREGIRNALLRGPRGEKDGDNSGRYALAGLPFWLGLGISALSVSIYLHRLPATTSAQRDFYVSLALYVLSALVELSVEPHYIAALRSSPPRLRVRIQAEGGMAITRAVVTVASVVLFERTGTGRPLLAFALGQLAGAVWLAARYIWSFGLGGMLSLDRAGWDPNMTSLAIANMRQSFVKHLLTEADRIAVGVICPLQDQGGYAIAMNYGSLVARIIFQPVEETLLLHFSSSPAISSIQLLKVATRLSAHLMLVIPAFLPPLLPALVPLLLPWRYMATSAPNVLETYLKAYIPLLSLNGILEAYHAATATPAEVKRQITWMIASSAAFVAALTVAKSSTSPETSLIYASCLAVTIRIAYALLHVRRRAQAVEQDLGFSILPSVPAALAAAFNGTLLRLAASITGHSTWRSRLELMGAGAVLGLTTLAVIAWREKGEVTRIWKGKVE